MTSAHGRFLRQVTAKSLAAEVIEEMRNLEAGGMFEDETRIDNLWDEACWAINEHGGDTAGDAAEDAIAQFSSGIVHGFFDHLEVLVSEAGGDTSESLKFRNDVRDHVVESVQSEVRDEIYHRDYSDLEGLDDEDEDEDLDLIEHDWEAEEPDVPVAVPLRMPWMLCRRDAVMLSDLRREIGDWLRFEVTGLEIVAIGAAIAKIDAVLNGQDAHHPVRISWVRKSDGQGFDHPQIDLTGSVIALELLSRAPDDEDSPVQCCAELDCDGGFDSRAVAAWLDELRDCRIEGAEMHIEFKEFLLAE